MKLEKANVEALIDVLAISLEPKSVEVIEAKCAGRLETVGVVRLFQVGFDQPYPNIRIMRVERKGEKPETEVFLNDDASAAKFWAENLRSLNKRKAEVEGTLRREVESLRDKPFGFFSWFRITLEFEGREAPIFYDGEGGICGKLPSGERVPLNLTDVELLKNRMVHEELERYLDPATPSKPRKVYARSYEVLGISLRSTETALLGKPLVPVALPSPRFLEAVENAYVEFQPKKSLTEVDFQRFEDEKNKIIKDLMTQLEQGVFEQKSRYWYENPVFQTPVRLDQKVVPRMS